MRRLAVIAGMVVALAAPAFGDDSDAAEDPHPVYSADDRWVRPFLYGVGGLFAAAAVVGPIVWMKARDTVPPASSHEEDPSADRR